MKLQFLNRLRVFTLLNAAVVLFCLFWLSSHVRAEQTNGLTFVVVHGAFGGGWDWKKVDRFLTQKGHIVYRPTLTGLGERVHLASPEVSLTTHIQDVVNVLRFESLSNVVLCGHSYAGMVITGVMDQVPERVKLAVFMDASLPENGESFIAFAAAAGWTSNDKVVNGSVKPDWLDTSKPPPIEVPQPQKTFSQPVAFTNPRARQIPAAYIFFLEKDERPEVLEEGNSDSMWLHTIWKRATARGYQIRKLKSDHLAERTHPQELADLLVDIAMGK